MKTTVLPVRITSMQIVCQLLASPCPWELKPFLSSIMLRNRSGHAPPAPLECNIQAFGSARSLLAVQLAPIELIQ